MARVNDFKKTKYSNIKAYKTANGEMHLYTSFKLQGKEYKNKNLTTLFGVKTAAKAKDKLEEIKTLLRQGINPFQMTKDKIEDIVLQDIKSKKSIVVGKDNSKYKETLTGFYYNYIHDVIGHLRMEKVTAGHVSKILNSLEGRSTSFKKNLRVLLNENFEKALRDGLIRSNPFYGINYGVDHGKPALEIRLNESMENVGKKLYQTALVFKGEGYRYPDEEYQLLFLLSVMLARRIGEIWNLTYGHIKRHDNGKWYVLTTPVITKTGIEEKYPLPEEAINLLPLDILNPDKYQKQIFNFSKPTMYIKTQKLVKDAELSINEGYVLSSHDNRNLFISILTHAGYDSNVADRCLSHAKKTTMNTYLDVNYEKRKEYFSAYWEILRQPLPEIE